jgi:hypothetical protein
MAFFAIRFPLFPARPLGVDRPRIEDTGTA